MNDPTTHLVVTDSLAIPLGELEHRASRSGGPGGQHVNTSSTRVEVLWNVRDSPSLSEEQRERILEKLSNRIDKEGVLHVADSSHRSQHRNREEATERLGRLVAQALYVQKRRKKTRPPRAAKEKRLRAKKQRAQVKRGRGRVRGDE